MLLTAAPAGAHPDRKHPYPHAHPCSHVRDAWSPARWRRGQPKASTIEALRGCPGWDKAKRRYYRARSRQLFRERVTPFHYAGHWWAAPYPIALCESGGDYYVGPYGAYGLIFEPPWMTPREQDLAAHRLYVAYGEAPWRPYESGCAYR